MFQDIQLYHMIEAVLSNPVFLKYGLIGLLANSFLASTILPIPVEITSTALIVGGESKLIVFLVWFIGSVMGGYFNYGIGRGGHKLFDRLKHVKHEDKKSQSLLNKYGWIIIFVAPFIPVIGDFINITAGVKRYDFRKFSIAMLAGKAVRIAIVVFVTGLIFN